MLIFDEDVCSTKFRLNFFRGKGEVNPKEFRYALGGPGFPVIVAKKMLAVLGIPGSKDVFRSCW